MSDAHASRREFARRLLLGAGTLAIAPASLLGCRAMTSTRGGAARALDPAVDDVVGWDRVPSILARIVPPRFPDRAFDVTTFGAVGDGRTDCTDAFRRVIAACSAAGGGRVLVPAGRFLTGPIHLRSRVELHVAREATIAFHQDPARYLPAVLTRWEGMEMMGYSPLIYALDQTDVAITGAGTLDGQADETHWWPWKGQRGVRDGTQAPARDRLMQLVEQRTPVAERVFAEGSYLRPQFIQPYRCRNVLIEGVTIVNSPMWEIHPVLCTNVTVRNVTIRTHGPNNDGCDPESCRDVLIEGCEFDTGDDCIAIKSGRNADGRRIGVPTENVVVRDCRMKDGHGGVTIGSEISGGVRHVYVERCTMDSPELDRALRFKNNALRGGVLEHVYMRDVVVGQVADAVLSVDLYYEEGRNGPFEPVVRDVELLRVTSRKSPYALYMRAYERSTIADVRVLDCRFDGVAKGSVTEGVRGLVLRGTTVNGQEVRA